MPPGSATYHKCRLPGSCSCHLPAWVAAVTNTAVPTGGMHLPFLDACRYAGYRVPDYVLGLPAGIAWRPFRCRCVFCRSGWAGTLTCLPATISRFYCRYLPFCSFLIVFLHLPAHLPTVSTWVQMGGFSATTCILPTAWVFTCSVRFIPAWVQWVPFSAVSFLLFACSAWRTVSGSGWRVDYGAACHVLYQISCLPAFLPAPACLPLRFWVPFLGLLPLEFSGSTVRSLPA